jgi:uncharacterized paraquat-inducible protein A
MREWEDREPTRDCPACGLAVLIEAQHCRWCQHRLDAPARTSPNRKPALAVAAGGTALIVLLWLAA